MEPANLHLDLTNDAVWEAMWAPYDEQTYQFVLEQVTPEDVAIEIGAGDLRLARQLALRVKKVYAIERQASLILRSPQAASAQLPVNLDVIIGDARWLNFPNDITVGVLLMRHCQHFAHYTEKLLQAGCQRLITNARWRLDVEVIQLQQAARPAYQDIPLGWYACLCGGTGFKPGPPEDLTTEVLATVSEVSECPNCQGQLTRWYK